MARLLIVEDNYVIAEAIRATLLDSGFDVIGATASPEQALDIAEHERPDLALVDVGLSADRPLKAEGVILAMRLRQRCGVPSLFVTGMAQPLKHSEGLGCLGKPFSEAQLVGAIEASLRLIEDGVVPDGVPEGVELWARSE